MKKPLVLILVIIFIASFSLTVLAAGPSDIFADVPSNHWAYSAIKKLSQEGILDGYEDGKFRGDRTLTRYELAVIVGNAMTKADKANAQQKALIDKLANEFNSELVKLGARVDKVEAKQKFTISTDTRIQYTHIGVDANSNNAGLGASKVNESNTFSERIRLNLNAQVNDLWQLSARIHQDNFNLSHGSAANAASKGAEIDHFYASGNVLGGKVDIGRTYLYPGKAGIVNRDERVDGVFYSRENEDKTLWGRVGIGRSGLSWAGYADNTTQKFTYAEMIWRPSKKADIGLMYFEQPNAAGQKDFKIQSVNGAYQINSDGLAVSFEAFKNVASDPAVNGKTGFWVALNSRYSYSWGVPALFTIVNPAVTKDHGWALSYRRLPAGALGNSSSMGMNAWATWDPWATDKNGNLVNGTENIKAIRFDYQYVPWKNVVLMAGYDYIQPLNKANGQKNVGVTYCAFNFLY